jgi:hypothetical protein
MQANSTIHPNAGVARRVNRWRPPEREAQDWIVCEGTIYLMDKQYTSVTEMARGFAS